MKSKYLSILLCFAVIVAALVLLPGEASAAETGTCGDNLTWTLDDAGTLTISGTGAMTDYAAAADSPWYRNRAIETVVIKDGVTSIGGRAFFDCRSLTSITIPDSVTGIGDCAFCNCSSLQSITIPENVTGIGDSAFSGCTGLTSISIPESITSIDILAFNNCSSLTYNLNNGDKYLGNAKNPYVVLIQASSTAITSVEVHENTKIIYSSAFYNCSSLTSITIPKNVTSIGRSAFNNCSSLTGLYISDIIAWCNVSFSDYYSNPLSYAKNLYLNGELVTELVIPDSVTSISAYAFEYCGSLQSVTIHENVTSIGDGAFRYCSSLTGIWVDKNNAKYCSDAYGILYNKEKTLLIQAPAMGFSGVYAISDSVTGIGSYAFSGCSSLNSITISDSVTGIGKYAFSDCGRLQSVTFGAGVTGIDWYAFKNCSSLTDITIPDSVTSIGSGALSGCSGLRSMTIPFVGDSRKTISDSYLYPVGYIFGFVPYPGGIRTIQSHYGFSTFDTTYSTYYIPSSLRSVTVTGGEIHYGAFSGCSNLTNIVLPKGIATIGLYAFSECTDLNSITIPASVTHIERSAFSDCENLRQVNYCGTQAQWDSITIDRYNDPLLDANLTVNNPPPHVCEYGDWIVTTLPTFTSEGQRSKTCSGCGNCITETLAMLVGKVSQWNIVLEDDYAVNFYLQISQSIRSTAKIRLAIGDQMLTYQAASLEETQDGYLRLTANISAAQMNDVIMVAVINGRDVGSTGTYSVREYCDTILADERHRQYHALVREMLHYGAMAQIYFDYDPENLANDSISGTAGTDIPETAEEAVRDSLSCADFCGASLLLRSRIAVRFYFTGNMTGCSFAANGNSYTPVSKDGMLYVEIADILPQDIDRQITLAVTDAAGNALTVTYGPMNYLVRMNQSDDTELKNLLKALYNYHLAAKELQTTA